MATQARAEPGQFLGHLILRAEAIYNFLPPLPPPARPWWKLWGREPVSEIPALVADLRNPTSGSPLTPNTSWPARANPSG